MLRGQRGASERSTGYARVTWEWTRSIIFAVVLFLAVRAFLVEAFKIPTSSMEGTLLVGDYLLVNKAVYGAEVPLLGLRLPAWREPSRGEVVVFHPPHDPDKNYVKRVVGVPGDTLQMRDKTLFVNGREMQENYVRHIDRSGDASHSNEVAEEPFVGRPHRSRSALQGRRWRVGGRLEVRPGTTIVRQGTTGVPSRSLNTAISFLETTGTTARTRDTGVS